jgi:hypothetical protein
MSGGSLDMSGGLVNSNKKTSASKLPPVQSMHGSNLPNNIPHFNKPTTPPQVKQKQVDFGPPKQQQFNEQYSNTVSGGQSQGNYQNQGQSQSNYQNNGQQNLFKKGGGKSFVPGVPKEYPVQLITKEKENINRLLQNGQYAVMTIGQIQVQFSRSELGLLQSPETQCAVLQFSEWLELKHERKIPEVGIMIFRFESGKAIFGRTAVVTDHLIFMEPFLKGDLMSLQRAQISHVCIPLKDIIL